MQELSKAQQRVYDAIKELIEEKGYSPSIREICDKTGLNSPATVSAHLKNLKYYGYIDYIENKNRTIRLKGEIW